MFRSIIVIMFILFLTSCKLFKRPSGGGGGGGFANPAQWLSDNVPTRNSCLGMHVDPTGDDVHVSPASRDNIWKKEWTESLFKDFDKQPYRSLLGDGVLKDETWSKLGCPNFHKLYDKQRRAVWTTFIAELARLESGHNPDERCHDGGVSCGLMQISVKTGRQSYGCNISSAFNPKEALRCSVLILNQNFRAPHQCGGKIPCRGSRCTGANGCGYFGPLRDLGHSGSKYKAFYRNVSQHISKLYPFCSTNKSNVTDLTELAKSNLPSGDYRKRIGQKSAKDNQCNHIANGDRSAKPSTDHEETKSRDVLNSETRRI